VRHGCCMREILALLGAIVATGHGRMRYSASVCRNPAHKIRYEDRSFGQHRHGLRSRGVTYLLRQIIKADVEGSETLALAVDFSRVEGEAVSGVFGVEAVLSVRLSLFTVMPPCGFFFLVIGGPRSLTIALRTLFPRQCFRFKVRSFALSPGLTRVYSVSPLNASHLSMHRASRGTQG